MKKNLISIYYIPFNQSTKFQITEIRKVLTLKNGRHLTDAGQRKLKWKCHRNENYCETTARFPCFTRKMQREDSESDLLTSTQFSRLLFEGQTTSQCKLPLMRSARSKINSLLDISCFKHRIRLIGWTKKYRAVAQR